MSHCAPYVKSNTETCFDLTQLINIATNYNKLNKDTIELSKIIKSKRKKKPHLLWKAISDKLSTECSNEKCWIKYSSDIEKARQRFRPYMPLTWKNNPREWLSNFDIQKVMQQYQNDTL